MNISEGKSDSAGKDEKTPSKKPKHRASLVIPKSVTDLQRIKLERLMQDPEKPIIIPPSTREKKTHEPPEFVRNVMGSSAGAGSGEFHVYRHLRRKEYSRQKYIDDKAAVERKNDDYHKRIEENKKLAEEKTAKKRAKRQKKNKGKKKVKLNKTQTNETNLAKEESDDSSATENENVDEENEDKNVVEENKADKVEKQNTTNTEKNQGVTTTT